MIKDLHVTGLIPGLRRSAGGGHDNPLQYSGMVLKIKLLPLP